MVTSATKEAESVHAAVPVGAVVGDAGAAVVGVAGAPPGAVVGAGVGAVVGEDGTAVGVAGAGGVWHAESMIAKAILKNANDLLISSPLTTISYRLHRRPVGTSWQC